MAVASPRSSRSSSASFASSRGGRFDRKIPLLHVQRVTSMRQTMTGCIQKRHAATCIRACWIVGRKAGAGSGRQSLNLSAHEKIGSELVSTDERPPVSTAGTMGTVQAVYVLQSRRIQSRGRLQLGEHGNHSADMPDWCDLHRPYQVAQFDL
jgi:hypothetical protein